MNITQTSGIVNNQFHSLKIIAVRPTPNSPHYEANIDVEVFDLIHLRNIRVARNRFGKVLTHLPEMPATRPGGKNMAYVWIDKAANKIQFDAAVHAALASYTGLK